MAKRASEPIILRLLLGIFRILPFDLVNRCGSLVGVMFFHFWKERKNIGLSNLRIAFPEKTDKELSAILEKCWKNIIKDILEVIKNNTASPEIIRERVTITGRENLDNCIAEGKGVIMVSAHFGNFPLLLQRLAVDGYPCAVIYNRMHNDLLAPLVPVIQRRAGLEPISDNPAHRCAVTSLAWLKKGGLLFLQIDQNPPRKAGVPVDFFGRRIPTFRGPVTFAMRTGGPILPAFILRREDNRHHIIIDSPYMIKSTGNKREDVEYNVQALSRIAEDYIRRYPSSWWWIHRRFRKEIPPES